MKVKFATHEQLFTLCVLLNWKAGLAVGGTTNDGDPFVVLRRSPHSNEGNGITKMYLETNATGCTERLPERVGDVKVLEFEVLGYPLQVAFDDKGTGAVVYRN